MIKRANPYGGILHEVVEHGGVLYLAGIVAEDLSPDIRAQTEDCLRQMKSLLEGHGSGMDRLLQVTIYLVDVADRDGFNAVWQARVKAGQMPARASIGVADLGPGVRVEIVATAAKR
jgi:enamine deaminase RidA (YjgF/YER057c/UK114 family)